MACSLSQSIVLNPDDQHILDNSDLRFGSYPPRWQKDDLPDLNHALYKHQAVVLPGNNNTNAECLVVLGGKRKLSCRRAVQTVQSLPLSLQNGDSQESGWCQYKSSLPDLRTAMHDFGLVRVRNKLYVFGGNDGEESVWKLDVLDLDHMEFGWQEITSAVPLNRHARAVAVHDRYLYFLLQTVELGCMSMVVYDTEMCIWTETTTTTSYHDQSAKQQQQPLRLECSVTSIVTDSATYIVVVGGWNFSSGGIEKAEAYDVEKDQWINLPNLPAGFPGRVGCLTASLGNRYILVAGGVDSCSNAPTQNVIALDWKTRQWLNLPPLVEPLSYAASVFAPSCSRWIVCGGRGRVTNADKEEASVRFRAFNVSTSLDICLGLGWAKEKLLLLCFFGKAQKSNSSNEKRGCGCLLEGLPAGVFANILLCLFVPFPQEVECAGSIFKKD